MKKRHSCSAAAAAAAAAGGRGAVLSGPPQDLERRRTKDAPELFSPGQRVLAAGAAAGHRHGAAGGDLREA